MAPTNWSRSPDFWVVRKDIESFSNDLAVELRRQQYVHRRRLLFGFSSDDKWNLGNNQLLTAKSNAKRLDLVLADGRQVTNDGFAGARSSTSMPPMTAATWLSTPSTNSRLHRSCGSMPVSGTRHHSVDGTLENNTFGVDTDGNPNTLYNNGTAVLNGTFSNLDYDKGAFAYTVGANYDFSRKIGVFARYSHGNSFPFFDNLRDGLRAISKVDTYEAGLKVSTRLVSAYLTAFYNEFEGLESTVIIDGAPTPESGGANAKGIELEGEVRPTTGLSLGFAATYLNADYVNFFSQAGTVNNDGNQVLRQPKWAWRLTPAYEIPIGSDGKVSLFSTIAFVGDRFADVENLQPLPSYYKVDAGVIYDVNERLQFSVTGDNLFDEIALTEGNPRLKGATTGASVISGRPLLGRSVPNSARATSSDCWLLMAGRERAPPRSFPFPAVRGRRLVPFRHGGRTQLPRFGSRSKKGAISTLSIGPVRSQPICCFDRARTLAFLLPFPPETAALRSGSRGRSGRYDGSSQRRSFR